MEGVGARLGRSSSRYGTTTVFTGPVRKWKKDWVPIIPPPPSNSNSNNNNNNNHINNNVNHISSNGTSSTNSSTSSHLLLYKWTPLSKINTKNNHNSNNNNNNGDLNNNENNSVDKDDDDDDAIPEEPPRRKFKFVPIAVLEEQKTEAEENTDDESQPVDTDDNVREQASKSDANDEKPDINDVPMEENEGDEDNQTAPARQDLNELDLSLGLTSHEEEHDSDSKTDPKEGSQP